MRYWVLHIGTISGKVCLAGLSLQYGCMDVTTCNDYIKSAISMFGDCRYFLVDEEHYNRWWKEYLS